MDCVSCDYEFYINYTRSEIVMASVLGTTEELVKTKMIPEKDKKYKEEKEVKVDKFVLVWSF